MYLQLLSSSFPVRANGAHFVVDQPPETRPRERELYNRITALDSAAAGALLDGSPAIVLPTHEVEVALFPPAGFAAGAVRLAVSAADGTAYVVTPGGTGNEGARSELPVAARRPAAPSPVPRRVPRLWARDAAEFVGLATATVSWPQMAGAVRYEVERALEAALGLGPAAKDDALVATAEGASPASFERVTNAAFLPRCTDELPGRAPTRAVYRVRGVSAANTPGEWQVVALVRVPDVRIPPPVQPADRHPDARGGPGRHLLLDPRRPA